MRFAQYCTLRNAQLNLWRKLKALSLFGDEPETVPLHGSKQAQCTQWLREVLRDGPRAPKKIVALGQQAGFSRRTIYYVRQEADFIADTQSPHAPGNQWILVSK